MTSSSHYSISQVFTPSRLKRVSNAPYLGAPMSLLEIGHVDAKGGVSMVDKDGKRRGCACNCR